MNKEIIKTKYGTFTEGEKVFYDVYPHGVNIEGIATKEGIQTIGKWQKEFIKVGMSDFIKFEDAQNIRKREVKK